MITLKSIRYGHANNSSSSHSIVFLGDREVTDVDANGEFGWNLFTCASKAAKATYILVTLKRNFECVYFEEKRMLINEKKPKEGFPERPGYDYDRVSEVKSKDLVKKEMIKHFDYLFQLTNIDIETFFEDNYEYHIDHQSIINFPVNQNLVGLNIDFLKQLFQVLLDYNFVFLGGNDNSDSGHKLRGFDIQNDISNPIMEIFNLLETEGNPFDYIALYDEKNRDWILQNRRSGNKIRLSFDIYDKSKPTTKSQYPELVDLKITNYCGYGCKFCYQSSTKEGEHAKLEDLKNIIDKLHNSKCMEIAIGGGEPTTHPDFVKILKYIKKEKMLVGFTTKNFEIDNHKDFEHIFLNADSVAFSCQKLEDVKLVKEIQDKVCDITSNPVSIYVQIILELTNPKVFKEILWYCNDNNLKVTILGYKEFGFGKRYKPTKFYDTDEWIDSVRSSGAEVGVDSIIVKKWKQELIARGVDDLMLVGEEGKFSCYIDAVEGVISKSSFVDESEKINLSTNDIFEQFYKF